MMLDLSMESFASWTGRDATPAAPSTPTGSSSTDGLSTRKPCARVSVSSVELSSRYVHPLAALREIVIYGMTQEPKLETTIRGVLGLAAPTPEQQLSANRQAGHQPGCACGHPKQPGCVQLRRMVMASGNWRLGSGEGEVGDAPDR